MNGQDYFGHNQANKIRIVAVIVIDFTFSTTHTRCITCIAPTVDDSLFLSIQTFSQVAQTDVVEVWFLSKQQTPRTKYTLSSSSYPHTHIVSTMAFQFSYYHQEEFGEYIFYTCTKRNKKHKQVLVFDKAARSPDEVFVWLDTRGVNRSGRYDILLFKLKEDYELDGAWEKEPSPTLQEWPPPAWRTFLSHANPVDNAIVLFGEFLEKQKYVDCSFQFINDPKKQWFTIEMDRYNLEYPDHYPVYRHGVKKFRFRYFHTEYGFADRTDAKQLNHLFDRNEEVVWKWGFRKFDAKQTFDKQSCAFDVNHVLRQASVTHTTPPEDLFRDRMASPLHVDHEGNIFSHVTPRMIHYDRGCLFNYMYYLWQMWPRKMRIAQETVQDEKLQEQSAELQEKNAELQEKNAELQKQNAELQKQSAELQKLRALLESKGVHVP